MADDRYETSIRMDGDLAQKVNTIAQVLGVSMNKIMVDALKETVMFYEGDPDFKEKHKQWLQRHSLIA